jgi:hypothetical protein
MLNEILNLEGVAVLSKEQQKSVNGGVMGYQDFFSGADGCSGPSCSSDVDCKNVCKGGTYGPYKEYCGTISCPTPGYEFAQHSKKVCTC